MSTRCRLVAAATLALSLGFTVAAAPPDARPGRHALLVACTKYPNLADRLQLDGPANDVVLMRAVLTQHFGFTDADISVLSDAEAAAKKTDARLATRANIAREFERLARVAKDGDQVFILMGGHGSQQPEANPNGDEPDGLDETFLPRDVGKWEDKTGTVKNAIVDDEMGAWIQKIRDRGASVFLIMDSCHSGTMTRGAENVKYRKVDSGNDLGIPARAVDAAVRRADARAAKSGAPKTRGALIDGGTTLKLADKPGLVALYAAQAHEPELELPMPPRTPDNKPHGLLSYTVCQVLTQAATAGQPITYRELGQRVQQQYSVWGRTSPTPVLEGGQRDREVMGDKLWPGRSQFTIRKSPRGFVVNVGSLHSVTRDSVFSVHPPAGQGDKLLGHVRIDRVRMNESDVSPTEFNNVAEPKDLPAGGVCKPVYVDAGDLKLRVGVDTLDDKGKAVDPALRKRLVQMILPLRDDQSVVEPVEDPKPGEVDWLVRSLDGKRVILVRGAGEAVAGGSRDPRAFGPVPIDAKLGAWLKDALTNIARVENLIKVVPADQAERDLAAKVGIELVVNKKPAPWPDPNLVVYDEDHVDLVLKNDGRVAIDVTVLFLDSSYGISCQFPDRSRGDNNRLRAGEKVKVPLDVNGITVGKEHILVIALAAGEGAADFSSLTQSSLVRHRGEQERGGKRRAALHSLLEKAAFGVGTRGVSRTSGGDADHQLQLVTWQVRPNKRPAEKKPR